MRSDHTVSTIHLRLSGKVQGVGFRPHIYRIATELGITGWARNLRGEVEIMASGTEQATALFMRRLIKEAPAVASPRISQRNETDSARLTATARFAILDSIHEEGENIHLPCDLDCCPRCLNELNDPTNRRYRYPFINCAECGPRYTAIIQLPYDRASTSMASFPRCAQCEKEYRNPADRRFHTEAISCSTCGPQLTFVAGNTRLNGTAGALIKTEQLLRAGKSIAIKGIGGYHLLCAASSDAAVARLRRQKGRPDKPLAVMFRNIDAVRRELLCDEITTALLCERSRPIVLCEKKGDTTLSTLVAPGLNQIGALLPYSPLHQLILNSADTALVVTSANISGEPVITEGDELEARSGDIADAFLHHDRPIIHSADDSLFQIIDKKPRPLRLGRGHAPLELTLPVTLDRPLLAVGGQMKNSIALAWDNRIVLSPHIGELDSPRSADLFRKTIDSLQRHYAVSAEGVICDAHPDHFSHRWAADNSLPVTRVYHHHAHASAIAAEQAFEESSLVFTWDGTGLGSDGTLWGGDALLGRPGMWQRVATMRPFRLPGGERTAREVWRCAASLCWHAGEAWANHPQAALLLSAWKKGINAPFTSSVGRLFDGAASLLGLIDHTTFEGQAAMLLQASAENSPPPSAAPLPSTANSEGVLVSDWQPLLIPLQNQNKTVAQRAALFHSVLAHTICELAVEIRQQHGPFIVGLNGGVFQNRHLAEEAIALLEEQGFKVILPQQLLCNDGALCYGQIIEAAAQR